jgi:hypothetical protein
VVVVVLVAVGLVAFARGPEHRRGQQVGALGAGDRVAPAARA